MNDEKKESFIHIPKEQLVNAKRKQHFFFVFFFMHDNNYHFIIFLI